LSEDANKTLPIDIDSDYSLPGRFEESNYENSDIVVESPQHNKWIWISIVSFIIISSGFFAYYFLNQDNIDSEIIENAIIIDPEKKLAEKYNTGEFGTDHAHAAIIVIVDDSQVNFALSQFQLASKYIHFENGNPYMIHRHATGVPLGMLFESLKIEMTEECFIFNEGVETQTEHCTSNNQPRIVYLNGEKYDSDISQYEIKQGDRILISYSITKSIPKILAFLDSLEIFDMPEKIPQNSGNNISV